jgi:hypothetical protein
MTAPEYQRATASASSHRTGEHAARGTSKVQTSHAVMAQRIEPRDSPDDFPTPPWATRALIEHALEDKRCLHSMACLEPACGAGHMAKVLLEYFAEVLPADAYAYGYREVRDFLTFPYPTHSTDWVITNPPFRLAERFVTQAMRIARHGVAVLARSVFLESVGRYDGIFWGAARIIVGQIR